MKKPGSRFPIAARFIVGNEACERFSYYGMKSILVLYSTTVLMKTHEDATAIVHLFGFANYFMPLLGAWISDRFFGRYKTILWVSMIYCLGNAVLACSGLSDGIDFKTICLYAGLGLIALGAGGIKPCVSAFMGDQFGKHQSHLLQKAYGAFYWSINLGSFFAALTIPWTKDNCGWTWAFAIPGMLMGIAVFVFWLGRKHYQHVPPSREERGEGVVRALAYALTRRGEKIPGDTFWSTARRKYAPVTVDSAIGLLRVLGIFVLIPPFWALFEQHNSTWVLQGSQMAPLHLFGAHITAEQFQSANPACVMTLVPILTLLVYPALGKLVTPLRRMGLGLFFTAASYVIVAWLQARLEGGETVPLSWQILPYIVITIGEVLVSTTGLEFAFTQAPRSLRSTITSFWLLTNAAGQLLVVGITTVLGGSGGGGGGGAVSSGRFMLYAGLMGVVAVVFVIVAQFYKYNTDAADAPAK
jgi:POT family proton-dependent oligopeptide transporter